MFGAETLRAGQTITIPAKVSNYHNDASTFQVYDPNKALGNVQPTVPRSHHGGSGILGQIFLAEVAAVVAYFTAGALLGPMSSLAASVGFSSTVAGGTAGTVAGTAVAVGSDAAIAGGVLAGAAAGAAGSVVSQGVGLATGLQSSFNWSAVGMAAVGVSVIVHAVNPPGYRDWGKLVLPMLDNTIAAAHAACARIVLPGTVYHFRPDALPEPHETSPQRPVTVKGKIRVEMERRLRAAADAGTPVLIVRAGDFFGPRMSANSWFSSMVKPGKPVAAITYPGRRGVGHQWAYLPDVAETMARLLEKPDMLERFAVFHMEGHWDAYGTQMIAAIRKVAGGPDIKARKLPWLLLRLLSPFVPLFRELMEMSYLWNVQLHMGNGRLKGFLGAEPHTPLEIAVRESLTGAGCPPRDFARDVPVSRFISSTQ